MRASEGLDVIHDRGPYRDPRRARAERATNRHAAGAVAVAIAAALARTGAAARADLLAETARWTPASRVRDGLLRAAALGLAFDVQLAGEELGTGANISAHDTVPFAVWVAARHLDSYEDALWTVTAHPGLDLDISGTTFSALDRDTLGAIVGGIVACATGRDGIPLLWREATEPLPSLAAALAPTTT